MTTYVDIDYETRSMADLKVVGGYNYCNHPTTEVLCAVAIIGETSYAWSPHVHLEWVKGVDHISREMPQEVLDAANAGATFVGHNAYGFDQYLWEALGNPVVPWVDTLLLARSNSLPGGLGKCGTLLFNEGKDDGGKIMLKLCKPARNGRYFPLNRQNMSVVTRYCYKDVQLMRRVRAVMVNQEPELIEVDRKINQRGFAFDVELAQRLVACDAVNRKQAIDHCVLDADVIRSNQQLMKWLEGCEVHLPNLQKGTINEVLDTETLIPEVRAVLEARIGATKITSAKVQRALGLVAEDGRIRNGFAYHAANTGRFGGRGLNLQNLPRGIKCDIDKLVAETMAGYQPTDDELSTLIRACVVGPLAIADYAQIEVRVLAWLAGQEDLLEEFRQGSDVYINLASRVFGVSADEVDGDQRQVGKALILGCGFGLGAKTFEIYGKGYGIDFESIGMDAQELVDLYRDSYPMIAGADTGRVYKGHKIREGGLWKAYGNAFKAIANFDSEEEHAGRCILKRLGDDVLVYLPSGRYLHYRKVAIEMRAPSWSVIPVPTIMYLSPKGYRSPLFPSKIAQNITQAVARDLLCYAMIEAEKVGLEIVSHCHDELIDQTANIDLLLSVMRQAPEWADGLPVDAEGKVVSRYCKV